MNYDIFLQQCILHLDTTFFFKHKNELEPATILVDKMTYLDVYLLNSRVAKTANACGYSKST